MSNNKTIFQGDPKIYITLNGANLDFRGGQPVMDQGLENYALLQLFTKSGWIGNALFSDPNQKIGSDFEEANKAPITVSSLNDVRDAAEKALQIMVDSGLASEIIVDTTNPSGSIRQTNILIRPVGADAFQLSVSKNGANWIAQIKDPAYLK
jgi:phage gp46-like protein